jgi:hypothetical protein
MITIISKQPPATLTPIIIFLAYSEISLSAFSSDSGLVKFLGGTIIGGFSSIGHSSPF